MRSQATRRRHFGPLRAVVKQRNRLRAERETDSAQSSDFSVSSRAAGRVTRLETSAGLGLRCWGVRPAGSRVWVPCLEHTAAAVPRRSMRPSRLRAAVPL